MTRRAGRLGVAVLLTALALSACSLPTSKRSTVAATTPPAGPPTARAYWERLYAISVTLAGKDAPDKKRACAELVELVELSNHNAGQRRYQLENGVQLELMGAAYYCEPTRFDTKQAALDLRSAMTGGPVPRFTPREFERRRKLPSCGRFTVTRNDEIPPAGERCMNAARGGRAGAELVVTVKASSYETHVNYFRYLPGDRVLWVFHDDTKDISARWSLVRCPNPTSLAMNYLCDEHRYLPVGANNSPWAPS